jgi:hypothetical protein
VKPQQVHCKLGETIEQTCSDVLSHIPKVCKGARLYNGYLASKDDHNSWGTCTISAECKTIIAAMLMVMSGMDPHMISGTWNGCSIKSLVGTCRSGFTRSCVSHGETPWCDRDRLLEE